jgi:hypothetical protein
VHGISVEPLEEGDYYGFEIDGDHLFLLGDFTVTHNTYLALRIAQQALERGKRVIFVCDRTTLINQTSAVADSYGLSAHGVIQANHWRYDSSYPFQIASVQTLARRNWPEADVIIIDESHTLYKSWTDHAQQTDAMVIGLSATPFAVGMGKIFTNLVNATTMHELTESGVLVPMRVFSCKKVDMTGAETSGGEWTHNAAETRGMDIIGDVVTEWQKHASDRKTIVFGATIAHCMEMMRQFQGAGISAACFTSDTDIDERAAMLEKFKSGELRVLISVEALAKGFDVPDVGCVCDVRPLRKSLSTAIQMWGRGLRCSPETGKSDCILLDFSGNIIRFADDFSDIFYNGLTELDAGEKMDKTIRRENEDEPEGKACPSCGHQPMGKRCIACGFEPQPRSLIEHQHGELVEVMVGKKKMADDKRHLYAQCVSYATAHSAPDKQAARAACIYRDITGDWPPRNWKPESVPGEPITRNVLNAIKAKNIRYAKAKEKARA